MFWPFKRRNLENPNLPLNDPQMWAQVFGDYFSSASGESISPRRAMEYAPYFQAVTMISGDIGRLPLRLYERTTSLGQESRRESIDYRGYLVGRQPNEFYGASQFWARVMQAVLIYGRACVEIVRRNDGSPARLLLLNPSKTKIEADENGRLAVVVRTVTERRLPPGNCLNIEWCGWDEIDVLTPYQQARNAIGLGIAQEKFASLFFANGGRLGGVLELPIGMPKAARDSIQDGFRDAYEASNAFKTVLLRDNAKFHQSQANPRDTQMVEAGQESRRAIASLFNLPASKLGLADGSSYNSKAEDNRGYLDNTLARWLCQIEEQCNLKLLQIGEQDSLFFEYDTNELLRLDKKSQAEMQSLQIQSRVKSPNECRLELNLPPYAGGEAFENPHTTSGATDNGEPEDAISDG